MTLGAMNAALGGGSWTPPASPPRVRRPVRIALIIVLLVLAFGGGTLVAARWELPSACRSAAKWMRRGDLDNRRNGRSDF